MRLTLTSPALQSLFKDPNNFESAEKEGRNLLGKIRIRFDDEQLLSIIKLVQKVL